MVLLDGEEPRVKAIQPKLTGFERVQSIANEVLRVLQVWSPDILVFEAIAAGGHGNIKSFVTTVECTTAIKLLAYQCEFNWIDVNPKTLKKWTTGNGNANKEYMAASVQHRWKFTSKNTDVVDAYALARLGQLDEAELKKMPGVSFFRSGRVRK
jgi:crossover junction endodeoxyribonuclease RuvC